MVALLLGDLAHLQFEPMMERCFTYHLSAGGMQLSILTALKKAIADPQFLATNSRRIDVPSAESFHAGNTASRSFRASAGSKGVSLPQQPPILHALSLRACEAGEIPHAATRSAWGSGVRVHTVCARAYMQAWLCQRYALIRCRGVSDELLHRSRRKRGSHSSGEPCRADRQRGGERQAPRGCRRAGCRE